MDVLKDSQIKSNQDFKRVNKYSNNYDLYIMKPVFLSKAEREKLKNKIVEEQNLKDESKKLETEQLRKGLMRPKGITKN